MAKDQSGKGSPAKESEITRGKSKSGVESDLKNLDVGDKTTEMPNKASDSDEATTKVVSSDEIQKLRDESEDTDVATAVRPASSIREESDIFTAVRPASSLRKDTDVSTTLRSAPSEPGDSVTKDTAVSTPLRPARSARKDTEEETTRVAGNGPGVSAAARGVTEVDEVHEGVGDVTAVTEIGDGANLDATDILAQRMDESPMAEAAALPPLKVKPPEKKSERATTAAETPSSTAVAKAAAAEASVAEPAALTEAAVAEASAQASLEEQAIVNPLASSRAHSAQLDATEFVVPSVFEEEGDDGSLADMVRLVRYRPPTKLAAIGSSIVLAAVAALWVAGDGSANAKASDEQLVAKNVDVDMPGHPIEPEQPDLQEPDPEETEAALAARLAAREAVDEKRREEERLEKERLAKEKQIAEEGSEPATPDPLETGDPAVVDEVAETPDENTEIEESPDAGAPDTPEEEMVFEDDPPDDTTPDDPPDDTTTDDETAKKTNPKRKDPDVKRPPKLSKKEQRAAAKALYKKASMAFMQGKLSASEKGFKAALKADPSLAIAYRGLGLVYERRGSKSRAAASLRRYLKRAPRAKDAKAIRARLDRLGK